MPTPGHSTPSSSKNVFKKAFYSWFYSFNKQPRLHSCANYWFSLCRIHRNATNIFLSNRRLHFLPLRRPRTHNHHFRRSYSADLSTIVVISSSRHRACIFYKFFVFVSLLRSTSRGDLSVSVRFLMKNILSQKFSVACSLT